MAMSDDDYGLAVTPREAADIARRERRKARRHAREIRETMSELRSPIHNRPAREPERPAGLTGDEMDTLESLLVRFGAHRHPSLPDRAVDDVRQILRYLDAVRR